MAKRKIDADRESAEEVAASAANPLALVVTKSVVGVLETNISALEEYVGAKLDEYRPDLYMGDADMAKKDRAELNNSKKALAQARITLMRELMKPYEDFETRCKSLEKKIEAASGQLDAIVKKREEQEKSLRRMRIDELWLSRNFTLFPLEKIFDTRWLNKTAREQDVVAEMDAAIARAYKDLKTIEQVSEICDVDTVKAFYLDSLDIGTALEYGEGLVRNREKVRQEAEERERREHADRIARQEREARQEAVRMRQDEPVRGLASDALGIAESDRREPVCDYVVSIKATREQLGRLKEAMNALGIEYGIEKLEF